MLFRSDAAAVYDAAGVDMPTANAALTSAGSEANGDAGSAADATTVADGRLVPAPRLPLFLRAERRLLTPPAGFPVPLELTVVWLAAHGHERDYGRTPAATASPAERQRESRLVDAARAAIMDDGDNHSASASALASIVAMNDADDVVTTDAVVKSESAVSSVTVATPAPSAGPYNVAAATAALQDELLNRFMSTRLPPGAPASVRVPLSASLAAVPRELEKAFQTACGFAARAAPPNNIRYAI